MYQYRNVIGGIIDPEQSSIRNNHQTVMNSIYTPNFGKCNHSSSCDNTSNMEFFKSVLRAFGLLEPAKVDFITELPLEVSQLILRKLDPEFLLCAAQVSRDWLSVCRSDKILRRTARHHKRAEERQMRVELLGTDTLPKRSAKISRKLRELKKIERNVPIKRFVAADVFGTSAYQRTRPTKTIVKVSDTAGVRPRKSIRM